MHKFPIKKFHAQFYHELFYFVKSKNIPYIIKKYDKNQFIALSDDECSHIGIIIKGEARIEQMLNNGKINLIKSLKQYNIFGEILIFSDNPKYPYDIISSTKIEIFFISKINLLKIFKDDINLLDIFLSHISASYLNLNNLIKLKSQKAIENKLAFYLIHFKKITKSNLSCKIKNKTHLADLIGVERQSLLRVLKKLQDKNCLVFNKNDIYIKDYHYFQKLIE